MRDKHPHLTPTFNLSLHLHLLLLFLLLLLLFPCTPWRVKISSSEILESQGVVVDEFF